jgi:hypothetical protein
MPTKTTTNRPRFICEAVEGPRPPEWEGGRLAEAAGHPPFTRGSLGAGGEWVRLPCREREVNRMGGANLAVECRPVITLSAGGPASTSLVSGRGGRLN